jgi:hypothetical protein
MRIVRGKALVSIAAGSLKTGANWKNRDGGGQMTRQRRWQLKMVREGKCRICGTPAVTRMLCEKHRLAANRRGRNAAHRQCGGRRRYSGAEYPGGKFATTIFHFPKWLLSEPFILQYYPHARIFSCRRLNDENAPIGFGKSVTQAAKCSLYWASKEPERRKQSSASNTASEG